MRLATEVNRLITQNVYGKGSPVMFHRADYVSRAQWARTYRGVFQVKLVTNGQWIELTKGDYLTCGTIRYDAPDAPTVPILSLSQLRADVPEFFNRSNKRFFGTSKYAVFNGKVGTFLVTRNKHSIAVYHYVPATGTDAADLLFAMHAPTYDAGRQLARALAHGKPLRATQNFLQHV